MSVTRRVPDSRCVHTPLAIDIVVRALFWTIPRFVRSIPRTNSVIIRNADLFVDKPGNRPRRGFRAPVSDSRRRVRFRRRTDKLGLFPRTFDHAGTRTA